MLLLNFVKNVFRELELCVNNWNMFLFQEKLLYPHFRKSGRLKGVLIQLIYFMYFESFYLLFLNVWPCFPQTFLQMCVELIETFASARARTLNFVYILINNYLNNITWCCLDHRCYESPQGIVLLLNGPCNALVAGISRNASGSHVFIWFSVYYCVLRDYVFDLWRPFYFPHL